MSVLIKNRSNVDTVHHYIADKRVPAYRQEHYGH